MNATQIILGALAIGTFLVGGVGLSCVSTRNEFRRAETGIVTEYKNNQVRLSNHFQKIQEMSQVPEMYRDDLKKVFDSAIQGRYGKEEKNPLVLFVQEHNPNFDSKLYHDLQVEIAAGRDDFKAGQIALQSRCQAKDNLQKATITGSLWLNGYEDSKQDWDKICTPITDNLTEKAFESGKSEPLKLRP
jgi:hypothetical protein